MLIARIAPIESAIKVSGDGVIRITLDLPNAGGDIVLPFLVNLIGKEFELQIEGFDESYTPTTNYFG